jgi:hypothetical protein
LDNSIALALLIFTMSATPPRFEGIAKTEKAA